MKAEVTATVIDGALRLDEPLDLPTNSRVNVTIESVEPTDAERRDAWDSFLQWIKDHPIDSGGQHFTRDELHERR